MTDDQTTEIEQWVATETPDGEPLIVLVIDDEKDGNYVVAFRLIERGTGGDGVERSYWTDNLHRPLLEAIIAVPHLVALLPREFASEIRTLEELLPRLGAALFVKVEDKSPQVQHVLDVRTQD
jgi:hypothetical protein